MAAVHERKRAFTSPHERVLVLEVTGNRSTR
jgi:hypothetical protein